MPRRGEAPWGGVESMIGKVSLATSSTTIKPSSQLRSATPQHPAHRPIMGSYQTVTMRLGKGSPMRTQEVCESKRHVWREGDY